MANYRDMGYNPEVDYANEIMKIMSMPISPDNLEIMKQLYGERYNKIRSNPETLGKYENDDIMRQAKIYLDMAPVTTKPLDLDSIYEGRNNANAENLAMAMNANQRAYDFGVQQIDDEYNDARRQIDLAYRINSLGNAELLAAQGLGRGYGQAPSSGYGETSALSQYTNYANNMANTYTDQQRAKDELYYNMMNNNTQAAMQHNNIADSIWASKGQDMYNSYQADRNYMFDSQGHNANVSQNYYSNNLAEREFTDNSNLNWSNNNLGWANHNENVRSNTVNEGLQKKKIDNDYEYNMGSLNVNRHRYGL